MARTALAKTLLPGAYATAGVVVTPQAADAVNFNSIVLTGNEIIIAENTDASAHTVTVHSAADFQGRTGDILAESIAAGAFHVFERFPLSGWLQADGTLWIDANSNLVKFLVLQLP